MAPSAAAIVLLPLELRELIYHFTIEQDHEVEITFGERDSLRCDAASVYHSLALVNRQIHAEYVHWFFSRVCFRFTDRDRPCRYILDAFLKRVPAENRKKITKVCVSYLSLATLEPFCRNTRRLLIEIATCPDPNNSRFLLATSDKYRPQSTYLTPLIASVFLATPHPIPSNTTLLTQFVNPLASDTVAGMEALASGFPSLKRLDLGLYIFEWFMHGSMPRTGILMQSLRRLNASPVIEDMQIRLQWNTGIHGNSFLRHDQLWLNVLQPEQWEPWTRGEQENFVELFNQEVKAREMTVDETRSPL